MKNKQQSVFKIILLQCLCLGVFSQKSFAQITVNDNKTALELAQGLVGSGATVSGATLDCPGTGEGTFTVTSSNLGLDYGILLTCGKAATDAFGNGANGPSSIYPSNSTGNGSDPDLLKFTLPQSSNDKCVLQFDFVPATNNIQFDYVFGSTEYQTYTCQFADVFGFFLSGPGITPDGAPYGPFSNGAKNIALVPGTNCPVGVNTINASTASTCGAFTAPCVNNGMYFTNNIGGTTVGYNGFTHVLTASSAVTPGSTYHLKLAVCDAGDEVLDSGVFLKGNSFGGSGNTSQTFDVTSCQPYSWAANGQTYSNTGVYTATFNNPTGITTYTLNLTIFCPNNNVPTISQWGLMILSLLSLAIGMIFIYKRQTSLAFAGTASSSNKSSLFNMALFAKVFAATLGLAVVGLFLSYAYYASITVTDTIGSVITAAIVAYMAHLYLLLKKSENN